MRDEIRETEWNEQNWNRIKNKTDINISARTNSQLISIRNKQQLCLFVFVLVGFSVFAAKFIKVNFKNWNWNSFFLYYCHFSTVALKKFPIWHELYIHDNDKTIPLRNDIYVCPILFLYLLMHTYMNENAAKHVNHHRVTFNIENVSFNLLK